MSDADLGRRKKDRSQLQRLFQELRPDTQKYFAVSSKGEHGEAANKDPLPALGLGRGSFQVPFQVPACDEMQIWVANQRPNCGHPDLVSCQTASIASIAPDPHNDWNA